jgi:acyl-CoA synthetase (AMP-forming)/AMP-acid ligase II
LRLVANADFLIESADVGVMRDRGLDSPGEIEDVLPMYPDGEDVAVIGVPDVAWGERIIFRASLPHTETGKLLRRTLKQQLSQAGPVAAT